MALTNYLMQSVVALVIFILLGYWAMLQRYQLYYIVLAVWLFQLIVSPIWLKLFEFCPAEWLWRYLTYGKPPPFHRGRGEPPALRALPCRPDSLFVSDIRQRVDRALQDVGGGERIDLLGAPGAAHVGVDHRPLDGLRRPTLIPQQDR